MNVYSKYSGFNLFRGLVENTNPIVSASDEGAQKNRIRPDGFLYGFNIYFNILYDLGAHPTVQYAYMEDPLVAESKEEIYAAYDKHPPFLSSDAEAEFRKRWDSMIKVRADGYYIIERNTIMSVLGWDPNDIDMSML